VAPSTYFCLLCGTRLQSSRQSFHRSSAKEKGSSLEDSVAGYFEQLGFDVQTRVRMRDRFDVPHEIDVLASKKEPYGTIQVAVECKHVRIPIDIREVRNFHDKLTALGITKGVFVSTGGFTTDAKTHAQALGIDLWEETAVSGKVAKEEISTEKDVIHDALPIHPAAISDLSPVHILNHRIFSANIQLLYRPYYFVDYHCFTEHTAGGNSIILESKGTVVIDGITGEIVGSKVHEGIEPDITSAYQASAYHYHRCIGVQPQTVTSPSITGDIPWSVVRPKVDSARLRELAKIELVKSLTLEYFSRGRPSRLKHLKPKKRDVEILGVQPVKIPLYLGTYHFKNYTYSRMSLAALPEIALVLDETASCLQCDRVPVSVCEDCGGIACEPHGKKCWVCGKSLCDVCATSKGIISRRFYCAGHRQV